MKKDIKILVIRLSSLGDIILVTPLIKSIRQNYPNSEIHFLVKEKYSEIIKSNPYIDEIIKIPDEINFTGLRKLKKEIKKKSYDIIFDLHNNLRTFYLRTFINSEKRIFRKYPLRKLLLVWFKINLMKNLPPVYKRYLSLCDIKSDFRPEIYPDESAMKEALEILSNIPAGKKIICIHPVSGHYTKTYPPDYYCQFIKHFPEDKYTFLLTGSENDRRVTAFIRENTGNNVYDLAGRTSLMSLAAIIKNASLLISGDTGPMHIAEAIEVPVLMLAGSSVKEFGFYPQNSNSFILENNDINCRPCSHIGRSYCPEKHFRCMKEIKPEILYSKAIEILENTS
ncbi:MAG: glycosyltransferase family 9 protein [Ignavibacteria bacterium]|nr:glycosyltransferase family 9 protein [Ignavibacteria bacterium]